MNTKQLNYQTNLNERDESRVSGLRGKSTPSPNNFKDLLLMPSPINSTYLKQPNDIIYSYYHQPAIKTKDAPPLQGLLNFDSSQVRHGAEKIAKLAHDYELMLQDSSRRSSSSNPSRLLQSASLMESSDITQFSIFFYVFPIGTIIFLTLFLIQCFIVHLATLTVLPLIGVLVMFYLVMFQRPPYPLAHIIGFAVVSLCILGFSLLILIIWALNSRVLFLHKSAPFTEIWVCPDIKITYSIEGNLIPFSCKLNHILLGVWAIGTAIFSGCVIIISSIAISQSMTKLKILHNNPYQNPDKLFRLKSFRSSMTNKSRINLMSSP